MKQQSLFDIDSVSCKHCGCFLGTLAEQRERCTENGSGTHEVMLHHCGEVMHSIFSQSGGIEGQRSFAGALQAGEMAPTNCPNIDHCIARIALIRHISPRLSRVNAAIESFSNPGSTYQSGTGIRQK